MGWEVLDVTSGNIVIHAALVETADGPAIFYFDGLFAEEGARLFRVEDRTVHPPPDEDGMETPGYHVMCSGHALLGDGRLLIAGGVVVQDLDHSGPLHDSGERRCYLYHPLVNKWEQVKDLNFQPDSEDDPRGGGRWYPTLVTIATGEVFAVSGHPYIGQELAGGVVDQSGADDYVFPGDDTHRHNNNTPERYSPGADDWALLTEDSTSFNNQLIDEYARVHLAPNGDVFFSTRAQLNDRFYDPFTGTYTGNDVPPGDAAYHSGSETTSVILPILMSDLNNVWVLACGDVAPQKINMAGVSVWESAGDRDTWSDPGTGGPAASPIRLHANSVILPTGEIFVTGGVGAANDEFPQGTSIRRPEVYTPPINWTTGKYTGGTGSWQTLPEAATVVRGYHGVALLMPDGAVFTGGSTDQAGGDSTADDVDENGNPVYARENDYRIEIYQPWYFDEVHQDNRPTVSGVPKTIGYGYPFRFTTQADNIQRVVLIRCGSTTHALDTDQRMVSVAFTKVNATTIQVALPIMPEYIPPGRYMLWVVDTGGHPCQWAPLIRISRQKPTFSVEFDKFARSEIDALGTPATFPSALFLVYDGFLPDEVTSVSRSIVWKGTNTEVSGVRTTLGAKKYESSADDKDVSQRIVIPVNVIFDDDSAFDDVPDDPGFRDFVLRATMGPYTTEVTLSLTKKLNPRMSDGDPHWLSIDLRAFSTREGAAPISAGLTHASSLSSAYDYIQELLADYNAWPADHPGEPHPFDALPTVQETNQLPMSSMIDDDRVFNFAVARVRFRAPEDIEAANVRVFFRLRTTGVAALDYSTDPAHGSYPRHGNGASAAPLLGLHGGEVNTIPCFAEPREADMSQQEDAANLKNLTGVGAPEVHSYYGCVLDTNQNVELFPLKPDPGDPGPFGGELKTIQEIMRGLHHCLVAEVHYWPDDPIPDSATPASSDNLSQRNLLFDEAPNPGGFATHLVHHTFELKASPVPIPPIGLPVPVGGSAQRPHPDELVIDWGNLPRESHVVFYMPQVDADEVLRFAAMRQGPANLSKAGPHSIRCKVTDVGFLPIPKTANAAIAGLLTVQLPPNLVHGQKFSFVLRQVDGRKLRVLGITQFDIHIKTAAAILPRLERNLSVLKHIALAIPQDSRWYPVFERYLAELGDRVRALGGNPDDIAASPDGNGKAKPCPDPCPDPGISTGKIRDLLYDCFGDFEGFVLESCDGRAIFKSCERALEEVVRRACRERSTVTVRPNPKDRTKPLKIIVHCC